MEGGLPNGAFILTGRDQEGWSAPEIRTVRFPGHPQETTENSVDLAHFLYVHGYDKVDRVGRVKMDGALPGEQF